MVKNQMRFCVYLVITVDNANNNINPGIRILQCETSYYMNDKD